MQKKCFKITVAVVMALMTVLLAGCSGAVSIPKPTMSENATSVAVDGSCEISVSGDKITVSGETSIMDGALLHVSVVSQDGMIVDFVKITKNGDAVSHDFTVTSEKYDDTVKAVTGYISCAPTIYGQQPQAVYDAYGKKFENIEAPDGSIVWNGDGVVVVFGSKSVDLAK